MRAATRTRTNGTNSKNGGREPLKNSQALARTFVVPVDLSVDDKLAPGNYRRICRASGISPQHIARVVTGRKGASFHVAKRIAEAAGVTLDELYAHIIASPGLNIKGRRTLIDRTIERIQVVNGTNGAKGKREKKYADATTRVKAAKRRYKVNRKRRMALMPPPPPPPVVVDDVDTI